MQPSKDQIEAILSSLEQSLPAPLEEMPLPFRELFAATVSSAREGNLEMLLNFPELIEQMFEEEEGGALTTKERFPLSNSAAATLLSEGNFDREDGALAESFDEAMQQTAEKALALDPSSIETLVWLGRHASELDQKLDYFRKACDAAERKDPQDVAFAMPEIRLQMAFDLHENAMWADAATILLPLKKESPLDEVGGRHLLTELLLRLGWDDELEEVYRVFEDKQFGPLPFAYAFLAFKQEGASPHSNALLNAANQIQPGVVRALLAATKPESSDDLTDSQFVAQCLLPGIRNIPGAMAWIREAVESLADEPTAGGLTDAGEIVRDDETGEVDRDPLGFVIKLKPTHEQWMLVVSKVGEAFTAIVLTTDMGLVQLESFASQPKAADLRALLLRAITNPIMGERRKPETLTVATKAILTALRRDCGTFDIKLEQQKLPAEMNRVIKPLMEGYLRQTQQAEGNDLESVEGVESLPICEETWLFAVFQPPMWINDRPTPWRPWMYLVQRASDGVILKTDSLDKMPTVESAVNVLRQAMSTPLIDSPRRPNQISCDPELPIPAQELEVALGFKDTVVDVGERELQKFFDEVIDNMLAFNSPVEGSLIHQEEVDEHFLAAFYDEASRFYKTAPWKMVAGDRLFEIRCDAWRNPVWGGCVIGQLGQELGLALYDSPDLARDFMNSQDASLMNALMIHFGEAFDTIPQDLWHLERNAWKVADSEAYPFISRVQNGDKLVCPSAGDMTALYETMRHATRFLDHPPSDPLAAKTADGDTVIFRWLQ
jgi:hypothetical protein